ncbi:hypothetical protein HY792_06515 [Candidatus Desantisbacteria bacterium]|nr:hypothetical protein [Candidatus Desantisbacteria bacterium]
MNSYFAPLYLCAFVPLCLSASLYAFCTGCSQVESRAVFMAKKNASEYARDIPGVKKHEIVAVKTVKNFKDTMRFLERNGVTSDIIRATAGDIVVIVRIHHRLQWMGKNIVFVCDSRGKLEYMVERTRPERPYVRW